MSVGPFRVVCECGYSLEGIENEVRAERFPEQHMDDQHDPWVEPDSPALAMGRRSIRRHAARGEA